MLVAVDATRGRDTRTRARRVPVRAGISVEAFRAEYLAADRPVVLTDVAASWPAIAKWTPAYLRAQAPGASVDVTAKTDYAEHGANHARTAEISLDTLLGYLEDDTVAPPELCYARHVYLLQCPALRDDVVPPPYLDARGAPAQAWIGPGGTVSQLHWDPAHNLYAQIRGRKRVILVAPEHALAVAPNRLALATLRDELAHRPGLCARLLAIQDERPADRAALRAALCRHLDARQRRFLFNLLAGFNKCEADIESAAVAARVPWWEAELEPGDLLFIPFMWRHHVRALSASISLNWFHPPTDRGAAGVREVMLDALCDHLTA